MRRLPLLLSLSLLAVCTAHAADDKPAEPPQVKPGWTILPDEVADAKIEALVNEDDNLRVEELRVRGQTKKIKVHFKNARIPDYEVIITDGKYETARPTLNSDAIRLTRVWSLLDY